MKNRLGRLLTVAVAASALSFATSCSLFVGSYDMKISPVGNVESQLQSLYVIVSQEEDVAEPLLSPSRYQELLEEDRIRKYTTFVQYQPEGGSWRQVYTGDSQSEYVTLKVKEELIKVKVSHNLIKKSGMTQFNVIVLAFFGSEGFEVAKVDHITLDDKADQVLQVSGGSLSLIDD